MFKPILRMAIAVLVPGGIAFATTFAPAANGAEAKKSQDTKQVGPFAKAIVSSSR